MRTRQTLAAVLAALMLLPTLAACSGNDGPADDSTSTADTSASSISDTTPDTTADTTPVETEATLAFAKEDNQNRTFTIMTATEDVYTEYLCEDKADRVSMAIEDRNRAVEEYLGIKLDIQHDSCGLKTSSVYCQNVINVIQAGDPYDYVTGWISLIVPSATAAYFYNFLEMPNLDLDNPWWVQGLEEGAAINNKLFLLDGDVCLSMYSGLSAVFVNRDLIKNKNMEDPYTLVNDGTWTLDKFLEMTAGAGEDVNGDGVYEAGVDVLGMLCEGNAWRAMNCALNVHSVTIEDGLPVVHDPDERLISASDKIWNYFNSNSDVLYNPGTHDGTTFNEIFASDKVVFLVHKIGNMTEMADMESDFGIIPLPKYDEDQEEYYTCVAGASQIILVPVNVEDPALTGKALEALSYYSYKDVVPAYYESALKERYSRDPETAKMLDLVRQGALNSVDVLFATTIGKGNNTLWPNFTVIGDAKQYGNGGASNLVSTMKKLRPMWEKNIETLVKNYTDSE